MYGEPTVKGMKLYSNQQFGAEGRNKHPTGTEWRNKNSKKMEMLRNLQDNFKHSNFWIIRVPEEEEEQEIENLLEKIMKENFPSLVKELDLEVQEAQSPKEVGLKEAHTKAHHNYITQH